jgi:predicted anti-sigma-YlaC factor YlaD
MVVYASGEASAETERLVEEHLAHCPACREAFGEEAAVEEVLAALETKEEPSNGRHFIARTRRLLFAVGVGALTMLACYLVALGRFVIEGMAAFSLPRLPGPSVPWLAVAGAMLVLYVALLFWRRGREAGTALGDFALSLLAAAPLLVLVLVVYQLAGTGGVPVVVLAGLFLLIALGATFGLLPRVPYATLTTVLILLLVSGLLVVEVVAGVMAQVEFSYQMPAQLGHPAEGVSPDEAARMDLTSIGLTRGEITGTAWVNNVWIGNQAEAARAAYEGERNRAFLTMVRFADTELADAFFVSWKEAVSEGVEIAHWEINLPGLPGQGRLYRAYEPRAGKAYSAWQNETWVTIVEVPGPVSAAMPLAQEIRGAVAKAYQE